MEALDLFLFIVSVVVAISITKEFFNIHKSSTSTLEAKRFFEQMSNANTENTNLKASVYTRGLTLAKSNKNTKYDLIPQSKLCDLGLS